MLGGLILSGSDKLMLSRIADDSVTGLYGFAVSVVTIINAVSISFNTAWMWKTKHKTYDITVDNAAPYMPRNGIQ